jgi:hypothetical protein
MTPDMSFGPRLGWDWGTAVRARDVSTYRAQIRYVLLIYVSFKSLLMFFTVLPTDYDDGQGLGNHGQGSRCVDVSSLNKVRSYICFFFKKVY